MSTSRVYCTQKLVTWGASQAFYSEVKINLILPQTARNSANIDKSYESHHYSRRIDIIEFDKCKLIVHNQGLSLSLTTASLVGQ